MAESTGVRYEHSAAEEQQSGRVDRGARTTLTITKAVLVVNHSCSRAS